jgi:hypothetical protein
MTTPQNNAPEHDPLQEFESTPAVSFDPSRGGIPENTWATMIVTDYIKIVQAKDDNGKPLFYEDSGKPVEKSILPVEIDGEARALWAKKNRVEGGLFRGLQGAQTALGSRIGPGTELAIKWHWDTSMPKKLGNHPKAYEVKAKAGQAPPPAEDPLVSAGSVTVGGGDEPPF